MGCLMEILGEILLELYVGIAKMFVPEDKITKNLTRIFKVIAAIVAIILWGMLVVGIGLIIDGGDRLGTGILLTVLSILIPLAMIILAAVIQTKRDQ